MRGLSFWPTIHGPQLWLNSKMKCMRVYPSEIFTIFFTGAIFRTFIISILYLVSTNLFVSFFTLSTDTKSILCVGKRSPESHNQQLAPPHLSPCHQARLHVGLRVSPVIESQQASASLLPSAVHPTVDATVHLRTKATLWFKIQLKNIKILNIIKKY